MGLARFSAGNHPQQSRRSGADDSIDDRATHPLDFAEFNERIWCNPPYSDIAPWVRKAWESWASTRGIAMLLPASRTEQPWWQVMVEPFRDRAGSPLRAEFLPGRMRFLKRGQTAVPPNQRPPFGCVLLTWSSLRSGEAAELVYRADDVRGGLFE